MFVGTSRLYCNLQLSFFLFYFFPFTCFAPILLFHYFACCFTFTTFLTCLGVHSWTELNQFFHNSSSFTFCTLLNILPSFSITGFTVAITFELMFFHATIKDLSQSDFNVYQFRFSFFGAWWLFSLVEEIKKVEARSSRRTPIFYSLFTILIIQLPLLWIC